MKQTKLEQVFHTFPAFYQTDSTILILGSIPSKKSREQGFYYMHPKNRFWNVLSSVLEEPFYETVELRKQMLKRHHIALWDVLASCEIKGSSDASIQNIVVNDIAGLLSKTKIKSIYTTGKKAFDLYQKYCYPKTGIASILLPSTSPANCACHTEKLIEEYQKIKELRV